MAHFMFDVPEYNSVAMLFTAIGTVLLWSKLGVEKGVEGIEVFALSRLISGLGVSGNKKMFAEFAVFVVLGVIVGVAVVQPTNVMQALAAGMGWTGLVAQSRVAHGNGNHSTA